MKNTNAYAVVQDEKIITDFGHISPLMVFYNPEEADECQTGDQRVIKVNIMEVIDEK